LEIPRGFRYFWMSLRRLSEFFADRLAEGFVPGHNIGL
jgi:hypothetical protein